MTHPFDPQPSVFAISIVVLTNLMPDDRRNFFLEWLPAHDERIACGREDSPQRVHAALEQWFSSLPYESARREYRAIIHEICWWEDLKPSALKRMLRKARNR